MAEWIKIDEGKYAQIADPLVQRVVTLEELKAEREKYMAQGVKTEPDEETKEHWNRTRGLEQMAMIVSQIDDDIAQIEALG